MQLSFLINDLLLVIVVISSMTIAILYPDFGSLFKDLPVYCLMANFFLSYLSIELSSIWNVLKSHSRHILAITVIKLVILPLFLFYVFNYLAPSYALSALLLTGISTGVVAPFISNLVKGNSSLVLVVLVITSILAPFTLPVIIKIFTVKQVEISLPGMIRMLATIIFIPILAVEILRIFAPRLTNYLLKGQFLVSLVLFAIINLGIFYRYAPFFKKEPYIIVMATIVAIVLSAIYCIAGINLFRKSSLDNKLAGAVIFGNMNNVLVIVFSSKFFGPVEPLVAAMYIVPFFGLIIPLRFYSQIKTMHN